jgi:hypothetical protein
MLHPCDLWPLAMLHSVAHAATFCNGHSIENSRLGAVK